jgi:transcription initiation factor IIE alpha subunit
VTNVIRKSSKLEMGSKKRIKGLKAQGELYVCPSCGYRDGFHVSFKWGKKSSSGEIYLICPNCHSRFRLGWNISVSKITS